MDTSKHMHHPTLVLIRGIPGSGKTYLTSALVHSIGAQNAVVLDPDLIDLKSEAYLAHSAQLAKEGVDQKFHLYRWSRAKAHAAIEANKIIMWNQPFTNFDGFNKTVINLQNYAADHHKHMPLLVVEVEADPKLARQRIVQRKKTGGHGPSEVTFDRFLADYRSFAPDGFTTVTVRGEDDIHASVAIVEQALRRLLAN